MRGFFISTTDNNRQQKFDNDPNANPKAFVYPLTYTVADSEIFYQTNGSWSPTTMELKDDHLLIKKTPGYHLKIEIPKNPDGENNQYFTKFCQRTDCSCDGWMEGKYYSPYKVTRFKNDRMFLLLAMDLSTKPVSVKNNTLERLLHGYTVIYK
jgi:hypothetical protein